MTSALVSPAFGQGAVSQSGVVTSRDFACWLQNGVMIDCGISSLNPLTLPSIAPGHVIGNASGSTQAAADYSLSAMFSTLGSVAQGDIIYYNGSSWVFLHAGTSGQFLETLGAGLNPLWATIPATSYSAGAGLTLASTTFSLSVPVTVARGGTGLTTGVSGGVLGYSADGVLAPSALLLSHGVMVGGGAGNTPRALSSLGTSGQTLTSAGLGADPTWTTPTTGTITQINTGNALTGGPITAAGTISAVNATSGVAGVVTPDTNAQHFLSGAGTWTVPLAASNGLSFGSGTVVGVNAFSGTTGVVTPDADAKHFLSGSGTWIVPVTAGTGITFSTGTVSLTSPNLSGTTGAIGGSTLTAACTSAIAVIANATTNMAVVATPVAYPGDTIRWDGYVSSAGTVTVKVCADVAGTPVATAYNVRVVQ